MSKCDLQIVFDNQNRTYRGGDLVTGHVQVTVSETVTCNGLKLERYWQTHGRGNRDKGGSYSGELFQGEWQPGQVYRYPFKFTAPAMPLTYRGNYLNIDHYVHVRADIPWAFDPKVTEEIVVLPGTGGTVEARPGVVTSSLNSGASKVGAVVGGVMMGVGLLLLIPCGVVLIPLGALILFLSLKNKIAEKKIGEVISHLGSDSVEPGAVVPIEVALSNPNAVVNKIFAKLKGQEICVSGSGTNKTTHKHTLYEQEVVLEPVQAPGQLKVAGYLHIPETTAYSFSGNANKIVWEVEARVDIPKWPDWVRKHGLVIRPRITTAQDNTPVESQDIDLDAMGSPVQVEPQRYDIGLVPETYRDEPIVSHEPTPAGPPIETTAAKAVTPPPLNPSHPFATPGESGDVKQPDPDAANLGMSDDMSAPTVDATVPGVNDSIPGASMPDVGTSLPDVDLSLPSVEPVEVPDMPDQSGGTTPADAGASADTPESPGDAAGATTLEQVVEQFGSADRFSGAYDDLVKSCQDATFSVAMKIEKIEKTFGFSMGDQFKNGRTVTGMLADGTPVTVRFPESRNDGIDAMSAGETLSTVGKLLTWNTLYKRPEMESTE